MVVILAGISTMGLQYGYHGWSSSRGQEIVRSSFPWLQTLLLNHGWIKMYASPRGIIGSGQVTVGVHTETFPKGDALFAWDLDEDGETEIQKPKLYRTEITYQQPGLYHPRVVVTDPEGWTYKAKIEVPVHDRIEFESQLNKQWRALWPALGQRDEKTLKQYTTDSFRKKKLVGFMGNSDLTEKMLARYSTPLSIVENYVDGSKWVIILQSTIPSPNTTNRTQSKFALNTIPTPMTMIILTPIGYSNTANCQKIIH